MSQEAQTGLLRRGRAPQNVGFRDRTGRQRRKQSKQSATQSRGDCPRFLVKPTYDGMSSDEGLHETHYLNDPYLSCRTGLF